MDKKNILTDQDRYKTYKDSLTNPFRPIQYLGSKFKLVDDISKIVDSNRTSNIFCDLFSGSGVVSHYLAKNNEVISVDTQHYSTIISSALTNGRKFTFEQINIFTKEAISSEVFNNLKIVFDPLIQIEEGLLRSKLLSDFDKIQFASFIENSSVYCFLNSTTKSQQNNSNVQIYSALKDFTKRYNNSSDKVKKAAYCSYYYGGVYFSFLQSVMIDSLLVNINKIKNIDPKAYSTLLAALLSTLSEIVATVGKQFAQPMKLTDKNNKPKRLLASRTVRDRNYNVIDIFTNWVIQYSKNCFQETNNRSITCDYQDFLKRHNENIGCFYADPPYTIDHYSRFYHILETIALYDYPDLAVMNKSNLGPVIMKGLYRKERYQSPFCIPSQVVGAFTNLFKEASKYNCPLLLSYSPFDRESSNRPRLISIEELINLAKHFYNNVELLEIKNHVHRKLNKAENNFGSHLNGEVLILCK